LPLRTVQTFAVIQAGANEGNAFVTDPHAYMPARAWVINLVGALIMAACVALAANDAESAETQWLLHPIASFSQDVLDSLVERGHSRFAPSSPQHGAGLFRNTASCGRKQPGDHFYGFAPIDAPIELLAQHISAVAAFGIVIVPLFCVLAIVISPVAARMWRR